MSVESLLAPEPGTLFLLANQAVARALLESDVKVAAFYPGSPVTEILDTVQALAERLDDLVMEISANEKLALETAAGAAFAGVRAFTAMKSVGLNVAADSFFSLGYTGVRGGLVILIADDPFCHSSQSEQDGRFFGEAAHVPLLEPSSPQEAYAMVKEAFDISERFGTAVLVRTTTRVNHQSAVVRTGALRRTPLARRSFREGGRSFFTLARWAREHKAGKLKALGDVQAFFETSPFNEVVPGEGDLGVVCSGISHAHVLDALTLLGIRVPVLKLGTTHPLPRRTLAEFLARVKRLLVVEELLPYLELRVAAAAMEANPSLEIFGKASGHLGTVGEYNVMTVTRALEALTGARAPVDFDAFEKRARDLQAILPPRPPTFCPGCPHRGTFWALTRALKGREAVFNNDIGCYSMMILPPFERTDTLLSMGASFGVNAGMSHVVTEKVVSACGDSTFFHAALPGLVNAVRHGHDMTVLILQNDVTAMTGQQASPASPFGPGMKAVVDIEAVVRAVGVEHVAVMNAFDPGKGVEILRKAVDHPGVSVVISRGPCALYHDRAERRAGGTIVPRRVKPEVCRSLQACIRDFHCPAIEIDAATGKASIVEDLCNGCGNCARLCPVSAIEAKGDAS